MWLARLASHLYFLYSVLPKPLVTLETRQRMIVNHARIHTFTIGLKSWINSKSRYRYRTFLKNTTIRNVVRRKKALLRTCYQDALLQNPRLSGKITLRFFIDSYGRLLWSHILSSTLGDEALERCFVQQTKRWRFPKIIFKRRLHQVTFSFVLQTR